MPDCIFCSIITGKTRGKIVYEDDLVVAIEDIRPQAPVHLLVIPRAHIVSLNDVKPDYEALLGRLFTVAGRLAKERGLDAKGYRTVINNGAWAGQSVAHLHVHLLGGRVFHWPPG